MTLRFFNDFLRRTELTEQANPFDRLVMIVTLVRSAIQQEKATIEGTAMALRAFRKQVGEFTTENIDAIVAELPDELMRVDISHECWEDLIALDAPIED